MHFDPLLALSYAMTAAPYVVAVSLGLLVPVLGVLSYSNFGVRAAMVAGMFGIEALYMDVGGIGLGLTLFYTDIALVFIFAIALLRLMFSKDRPRLSKAWLVFCAVAAISLAAGLASYGSTAGVQARPYFYFFAAALYGISFGIDARRLRILFNLLALIALLLVGITIYRWIVYYTPITSLLPPEGAYNNDGPIRVIRSFEALEIAEVLMVCVFFVRASGSLTVLRALSPLLFAAVLILQHRSVWMTALAGVLASVIVARLRKSSGFAQLALLLALALTTMLPMVMSDKLSGVDQQISSSAGSALDERGSVGERMSSWKEIVNNWATGGPKSILIGQSFGTDPTRYVQDERGGLRKITYMAHNMYVQTLFNTGILGLGAFVLAAAGVVQGLYRLCAGGQAGVEAQALLVLVVMQLVYYVPYGTDYLQGLVLGAALSYVAGCREPKAAGQRPAWIKGRAQPWGWA